MSNNHSARSDDPSGTKPPETSPSGISPLAGQPAGPAQIIDVARLLEAYHAIHPDPADPAQQVAFGTSGHRGCALDGSFNEDHILAITQAICRHRARAGADGPLFIGIDTHAVSRPACDTALEVLAANGVTALVASGRDFTPTPVVSHAILAWNRGRTQGLADGIVVTPSHNPPRDGGFKYNPPNGGPAQAQVTGWIQEQANGLLRERLQGVRRIPLAQARAGGLVREHDYRSAYVEDLASVIDFDLVRGAGLHIGVDPLGGAGVHYWRHIRDRYRIDLAVVSEVVDPTFSFMTLDWDGQIRMDPSSKYAMQRLLALKDRYDIAFACDTDHDRHGIVTRGSGLLPANHYLAVMIDALFRSRPDWGSGAAVGKTVVSSSMIDRVAARAGRTLFEVPVGFKWFADGLLDGTLGFAGEESAGASFLRRDGATWTTDKDGIVPALLSAEITARAGIDPGACHAHLEEALGACYGDRVDTPADAGQRRALAALKVGDVRIDTLAGAPVKKIIDHAPGNRAPIGGVKVVGEHGWFAARPSGTEDICKLYAESFRSRQHLETIVDEARQLLARVTG